MTAAIIFLRKEQRDAERISSLDKMGKALPLLKEKARSDNASKIESLSGEREKYLQVSAEMKRITRGKKLINTQGGDPFFPAAPVQRLDNVLAMVVALGIVKG